MTKLINKIRYYIFIYILLLSIPLSSQIYNITKFNQDDGLPSSYIYGITQDATGFLHIATGEGLCTYDGYKFVNYNITNGLIENKISAIASGKNNAVYLGFFEKGLSLKSITGFINYDQTRKFESPVSTIAEFNGKVYFGTKNGKVGFINNSKVTMLNVDGATVINKLIQVNSTVYIATDNGLYEMDQQQKINLLSETEGSNFTSICLFDKTKLVIGNDNGEIIVYNILNKVLNFVSKTKISGSLPIKDLVQLNSKKFAAASWGRGIYVFDLINNGLNLKNLQNISEKNGLENTYVNSLYLDFNSNLWIGTFGGGLFKYTNNHFKFYNKLSGLQSERIKAVCITKNEAFVGLENGFQCINLFNNDSSKIYNAKSNFIDDAVNSIEKYGTNEYLIGTENNGLILFNTKTKKQTNYFVQIGIKSYPKTINHISLSRDSTLYISTIDGLIVYNLNNRNLIKLNTDRGLPHNNILYTYKDTKQRVWFAAPKSCPGLIHGDSVTLFKDIPNFKSYTIIAICEGEKGAIYIATQGDGIYKYLDGKFEQINKSNGLVSDFIYGMSYDKNTHVLAATHANGLSIINTHTNKIEKISNRVNNKIFENTQNTICFANNELFFGTQQGLGIFNINDRNTMSLAPRNKILRVIINNKIYSNVDTIINLSYDSYTIKFDYIGIELSNPLDVIYKYKLDGLENEFKTTKENRVEYNKLKDGDYTFILSSINSQGVESTNAINLRINIDKPIYKKWWFLILCFVFIVLAIYLFIDSRTKKLRKDKYELEKRVREKTADITKINELIQAKNHDITSSINYANLIQKVLLPKTEDIITHFDTFIFYKARDIVSGDFYWFYQERDYIYIAAVDCTGHGVPGAFMSIIGTSFLNQILVEHNDLTPSQILTLLDKKIVKSLRQTENEQVKDGMDIALCRICKKTKEVVFCGAGRPLYIVHNTIFKEYKSKFNSIGGYNEGSVKEFIDHTFAYEPGMMIYMFSDGYADQFGSNKNKRYSTKKLKEFLVKIAHLDTDIQRKHILIEFENWKGDRSQIDDILFMGIKF